MLDLLVLLAAVGAAVGGYRIGFLTRAISWAGLALGVLLAVAILPNLMRRLDDGSHVTILMLIVATLLGCALVGQGIGLAIGSRLHVALPHGSARDADRVAGGALGVVGVVVFVWLLLPTMASVPGMVSEQARGSAIAQEVHEHLPDPPDNIQDLRRLAGDTFPEVFDGMTTAPDAGPPPGGAVLDDGTRNAVRRSTVKVEGVACRRVQEGSGWALSSDLVVTNAHVVAGEAETQVELFDGSEHDAVVVAYDSGRDLAVLRVEGVSLAPLDPRDGSVEDTGEVFGHTGGGPMQFSPFRVDDEIAAVGTDIYDRQRSEREVLVLASDLAPGDSGGALVDAQGQVVGTAFAVAPDRDGVAYALDNAELDGLLGTADLTTAADTGNCLV